MKESIVNVDPDVALVEAARSDATHKDKFVAQLRNRLSAYIDAVVIYKGAIGEAREQLETKALEISQLEKERDMWRAAYEMEKAAGDLP